jgi:hypothetical protein
MTVELQSSQNTLGGMIVGAWLTLLAVSWVLRLWGWCQRRRSPEDARLTPIDV